MPRRCRSCGGRALWLPEMQTDRWYCERCGTSLETAPGHNHARRARAVFKAATSPRRRVRDAAHSALTALGPAGLPFLGLALSYTLERRLLWTWCLLGLFGVGAIGFLVSGPTGTTGVLAVSAAIAALILLGLGLHGYWRRETVVATPEIRAAAERAAYAAYTSLGDALIGLVGGCVYPVTADTALRRMAELIPTLAEDDARQLTEGNIRTLCGSLRYPASVRRKNRRWEMTGLIADVLAMTSNPYALGKLRELTSSLWYAHEVPRDIRKRARQAIETIEVRMAVDRDNSMLLRAAAATDDPDTATLLRPVAEPDLPADQLLRPASADDPTE